MIYISIICLALAAVCNAIMDTSVHHFSTSIFKNLNPLFWNGEISWRAKYINGDPKQGRVKWYFGLNKPVQLTDAFHFFKMLMIIFICSAIAFYSPVLLIARYGWISYLIMIAIFGTIWNTTFSLFYDKILR